MAEAAVFHYETEAEWKGDKALSLRGASGSQRRYVHVVERLEAVLSGIWFPYRVRSNK